MSEECQALPQRCSLVSDVIVLYFSLMIPVNSLCLFQEDFMNGLVLVFTEQKADF